MSPARAVELVVPEGIDDPLRPSGGNTYDRRLRAELRAAGWVVRTREVGDLAAALAEAADGSVVLVDGLVASGRPEAVVPAARRLRLVALVHLPFGVDGDGADREREAEVLRAAAAVVTTSEWTRRWLRDAYGLVPDRVHVARPGVDVARLAPGTAGGTNLLCVGAVTPGKGHDALVAALAGVADRPWRCVCVGSLTRSPDFVARVRHDLRATGLEDRVVLTGARGGAGLDEEYAAADALLLASRTETYGMVVTEALARGLPVLGWDVGGVPEALGTNPDGTRPGLLVPAGDVAALTGAVRAWLDDAGLRARLREAAARRRRTGLGGWPETAARVARVLETVQLVAA